MTDGDYIGFDSGRPAWDFSAPRCEDCGVLLDRHGSDCGYEIGDHASGYFETPEWSY